MLKRRFVIRIWDYVLCLLCQTGLIFHIFSGFVLEDGVSRSIPLTILLLAVLDLAYFGFSFNRLLSILGVIVCLAAAAMFFCWAVLFQAFEDESANSLGITLALILLVSVVVYLLTRRRAGIIILFIAGTLIDAGAHFLQYEIMLWPFLVFEAAVFLMYLYRNFMITGKEVHTGKVKIPVFAGQTVVLCLIALFISLGLYYGVVRPMNPPTKELELISAMEERDLLWLFGIEKKPEKPKPEQPSPEEEKPAEEPEKDPEQPPEAEQKQEKQTEPQDPAAGQNEPENPAAGETGGFFKKHKAMGILLLVVIALAAAFVAWYLRKKKWQERVERLSPENRVINYYRYFLSRFARLGYSRQPQQTLLEYAEDLSGKMQGFESGGITFEQLTKVYVDTYYGARPVSEEEAGRFRSFYNGFAKNLKEKIGPFRYFLQYFFL